MVVAADDDQDVPAGELGPDLGHADAVEQQVALAAHVLGWCSTANASSWVDSPACASVISAATVCGVCARALGDGVLADVDACRRRRGSWCPP